MSRILLVEPYEFLEVQYSESRGHAIYAQKAVVYWSNGTRQCAEVEYPNTVSSETDLEAIKTKIAWNMPLWSRWMGEADRYEDYRQICLLFVVRMAEVLRELDVKHVIFFTGVAHHIEYSLIEAACQISGAKQIYLYPMPFFTAPSRLLPMAQHRSIRDRHILGTLVSSKAARDEVLSYRDNYLAAKPPQLNEKIDRVATSYQNALKQVLILGLKTMAKRILRHNTKVNPHPVDQQKDYNWLSMLNIVKHQKIALDYYSSHMLDESSVDQMLQNSGTLPIIYAHYQPEASTFPEGGDYSSHLDVVIAMRRLGYSGKILYKEHPGSWIYYSRVIGFSRVGLCRSVEYYRQLAALGCLFVDPSYKVREHRLQELFPVTITGSVGIERSITGMATCCAGVPWFKGAPGVYDLTDTFGDGGVFFNHQRWRFDPDQGIEWFAQALAQRTISNYPGIGTGVSSGNATEKTKFLNELDSLMNNMGKSEVLA